MNIAQFKCLSVFAIFAVIGFGPVSPGCLIGLYVVWARPEWFLSLVRRVYNHPPDLQDFVMSKQSRIARIKGFLSLLLLFIVDIIPIPITPIIAFSIILSRPQWFYLLVRRIYGESA